jgi:hypothetical protein
MWAASIAVALALWGPPPCAMVVKVAELDGALGRATYGGPVCLIEVDARRWRWWSLCSTVLHEWGHTHGQPHGGSPGDLMYPALVRMADPCRGQRPPRYRRGAVIRLDMQ